MIPIEIQDYETYVISYSGGKDSTATLLWALENLPRERLRVMFCDTGAEWPETYDYLSYIERETHLAIERISNEGESLPPDSSKFRIWSSAPTLLEMVRRHGKWPSGKIRYCTKYLKMYPLRLHAPSNSVLLFGERRAESKHRASLEKWDINGAGFHKSPIFRPILDWSERKVWDYLRSHHILPNPVYNHATRCGCWCCIMAPKIQVLNFCRLHPEIAQEAAGLEQEIEHTWRKDQSIGDLLAQAQAQLELFGRSPRFECPLENGIGKTEIGNSYSAA